ASVTGARLGAARAGAGVNPESAALADGRSEGAAMVAAPLAPASKSMRGWDVEDTARIAICDLVAGLPHTLRKHRTNPP
ncbi:hypothetical protein, partial [Xanthomonas translucens]|uniref:hypothetical protein n=1 Tax=Xanthomonas campestris pv. translucens TaxID=343 RepID=UPI0019D3E95E